jgi:hypothetical protein
MVSAVFVARVLAPMPPFGDWQVRAFTPTRGAARTNWLVGGKGKLWRQWGVRLWEIDGPKGVPVLDFRLYPPPGPLPPRMMTPPQDPEGGPGLPADDPDWTHTRVEFFPQSRPMQEINEIWIRRGGIVIARLKVAS